MNYAKINYQIKYYIIKPDMMTRAEDRREQHTFLTNHLFIFVCLAISSNAVGRI